MNIYISVVVWGIIPGMHEQYACAVLIEWLVIECSRCSAVSVFHWGQLYQS